MDDLGCDLPQLMVGTPYRSLDNEFISDVSWAGKQCEGRKVCLVRGAAAKLVHVIAS